ncbi:Sphingolipid C4-hydroxylase SUR2 [Colletotrichum truncatum]|uniref:Sphingolipid C4-hydroxylase SUR2 n=1 Tax=Colletotrichum truncatum TaxID=5467 RepID=A0ACC3YV20_COLTU|nr:Sphingolipid C4-hydroxylase SUR2 [Colletotrichum truncatum]KAF6781203.1 Sphingolipid C4-hydroxylase SUR2 [Colletotrichum truncatum]
MTRNQTTFDYEAFLTPPKHGIESPQPPRTLLGMDDARASVVVPLLAYWVVSIFYETAHYSGWFDKYRVYPTGEEKRRNLVTRWETLRVVIVMHVVQLVFGLVMASILEPADGAVAGVSVWGQFGSAEFFGLEIKRRLPNVASVLRPEALWMISHSFRWAWLGLRQLIAFFLFDTWAYWVHYFEHMIPFLYRRIHSVHHYNYIPYSYAASYNHPIEGFFNDILGSYLSSRLVGLSDREAMVFFATASVKAVDDHASLELPWNPLNLWGYIFGNGMVHHNIHHQVWGLKVRKLSCPLVLLWLLQTNYGLYFTFWDRVNNTIYKGSRRLSEAKEKWAAQHKEETEKKDN